MIAGINEILVEDETIEELVGNNAAGDKVKVYPVVAPSGESFPYITTSLASLRTTESKREANNLDYHSAAINIHATSYDSVQEIADAVKTIFDGPEGTGNGFNTDAGFRFLKTWVANEFDRPEMYTSDHPAFVRTIVVNVELRRN